MAKQEHAKGPSLDHVDLKEKSIEFLAESIESYYTHSIMVDAEGYITRITDTYARFLELTESPLGKHVTEIIPNSFLPGVIKTGQPVFLDLIKIKGQWIVVSAIPLKDQKGDVVGGFAFFATDSISPLLAKYNRLQNQLTEAKSQLALSRTVRYSLSEIVGHSEAIQAVKRQIRQAARFDISVLVTGETGTGKELFAQALHDLSARANGPFVSLNVAAIPENLIETEFFGAAPGAYTGASKQGRKGKLELAAGGTLFLDEIGDMPLDLQSKLLRVLQEKQYEPVGSNELRQVDIRIVAATSRNLLEMVENGRFRADLYYRLNAMPIRLPPLRERITDIALLGEKFVDEITHQLGLPSKELSPGALELLSQHAWPGNVRELRNVIERACITSPTATIDESVLSSIFTRVPVHSQPQPQDGAPIAFTGASVKPMTMDERLKETERAAIREALEYTRGHRTEAAKVLGISRPNLYSRIKKLGI